MKALLLTLIWFTFVGCSKPGFGPPEVETRPKKYPSALADWHKQGLADHFPKAIPKRATATKFSASPGFLQGGGWFQLRLTLSPAEVARVFEEATKQAKAFYDGGDLLKLVNEKKDGLPGTDFHTADSDERDFPTDYRIFTYHARSSPNSGFDWNHGESRGVVVSRMRNEVICFAESW